MDCKRTWMYCRVDYSGANSAELLEMQRHGLEAYAKEHGLQIIGFSCDTGNGLTLDRPGLKAFHAMVDSGEVDVLLIHNLDRLGWDSDKIVSYWQFLQNHGVRVYTASIGEIDLGGNMAFPGLTKNNIFAQSIIESSLDDAPGGFHLFKIKEMELH